MQTESEVPQLKILVFSDSHRSLIGMYRAIDQHKPQQVIHLGDLEQDIEEVAEHYPQLPFCTVPGNCDGWTTAPLKKQITLEGVSILLSHGHLWGVKGAVRAAPGGFCAGPSPTPGPAWRTSCSSATPTRPCASGWRTACG